MLWETLDDIPSMLTCYVYILSIILVSGRMAKFLHMSLKASWEFLHAMIGNLLCVMPFF